MTTRKRRFLLTLLLVASLGLLVACGGAETLPNAGEGEDLATPAVATPTEPLPATDTPEPEPTEEPEPAATDEPEATATSEPEPTATEEPEEMDMAAGGLEVEDQELSADNTVTIPLVESDGDGWLVIHADNDGAPGPVIGFAAVSAGSNEDVAVTIDPAGGTETVHAMLHVDEGIAGVYEFPGPDAPARDAADTIVMAPFALGGLPDDAVSVIDQLASDSNTVVVPAVRASEDGWIVIHSDNNGAPGPVAGFAPVSAGANHNIAVELDPAVATATLHAMLHVDAGVAGEYEFPGDDGPVMDAGGSVVMLPFQVVEVVSMLDSEFVPGVLLVPAGATVTWQNDGQFPHTATADSGAFDSDQLQSGESFDFTFDAPGYFDYYCALHGGPGGVGMAGTIVVAPGS
jgi:plastocyanin